MLVRRCDELIEVRKGLVAGCEAPEQFLWRDRRWVVCRLLGYWVETGAWWEQPGVSALLGGGEEGGEEGGRDAPGPATVAELLEEHEVWRVEAARRQFNIGVFDLAFSWGDASWRLRCILD